MGSAKKVEPAKTEYVSIVRTAFIHWAKNHKKYSRLYKKIGKEVLTVGFIALKEMYPLKPGTYEVWWAKEHNRFIRKKGVTQKELSLLNEIMYYFLTAYCRGELNNGTDTKKSKNRKT